MGSCKPRPESFARAAALLKAHPLFAGADGASIARTLNFVRIVSVAKGETLFRKGDPAAEVYYLVDGGIDFPEIGVSLPPGRIFGEIAFFTHERKRTQTARCTVDSTVMTIDEATLKELYYQNPEFGFHLVSLVARRLAGNVDRLEAQLAALPYGVETHAPEQGGH